ncbi:MAG: ROK family transcriptional regulator [Candidatus Bipolaricaulota bacterium]
MRIPKGDQDLVRRQNRALIINLLRLHGTLSRTEIADRTGLAPSCLTRVVRELLEEGVVREMGKQGSSGGRPAVLLSLNPEYAVSIGVKVERERVLAASVDMTGRIVRRDAIAIDSPPSPQCVLEVTGRLAERLAAERTLGIGLAVSGFVDPTAGVDLYSPILGWERVPLREPLEARLGLPVWVENDVNALALAERWYGAGRQFQHFICITVGEGIGAGVVLSGEIYRGAFGGAGEVGHMTIDPDGPVCRCQERGCLEVYASDRFLKEEASRLGFASVDAMAHAARNGQGAAAREAFTRMGRFLGLGAKNLVNLLNPEAVVLGGERMDAADLFLPALEDVVRRHSFPAEADRLAIVPAELGSDGFLIGAATLVAAEFFRVPAQGGLE